MERPARPVLAFAVVVGLVNVGTVGGLYAYFEYPLLESGPAVVAFVLSAFAVGFVPALITAHTRLLTPLLSFLGVLGGTVVLEVTSPAPEWGELGGYPIVQGPTYAGSYASAWYLWIALFLLIGVLEFAVRRGYGIGDARLRNLPELPLGWGVLVRAVAWIAALFGLAVALLALGRGASPVAGLTVLIAAAAVAAVPLAALLSRGLLSPMVLFAIWVPYVLILDVYVALDSPVHLFLFGPYALVLALAWVLEERIRRKRSGWDGGRFAARSSGGQ